MNLPRIVHRLECRERDTATLARCMVDSGIIADDHFDYSKVVVKKPWGYEYLIFQNEWVAVWVLYIKLGASTSMHCHLRKKTSLSVLSGAVVCSTLEGDTPRQAGEGMMIGEAVFHQTRATSPKGAFVMEIETPVNKRDLVRFKDPYGREGLGYESSDHMTVNVSNYNYISFISSTIYYNVKKRFEDTSIRLVQSHRERDLRELLGGGSCELIGILKGRVNGNSRSYSAGDMLEYEECAAERSLKVEAGFEAVVISLSDRLVRAADFIVSHLKSRQVLSFFFAPGRSNAHLVDAVAREAELNFIPQTSDASAAWAAVTHAKLTGEPSCCILSTGAGGTSAITAAADAWTDSAPVLFISAQSCLSTLSVPENDSLRQLANKQLPIAELVQPITKSAVALKDVSRLKEHLDRALHLSMQGRRGPVWIDIPIDMLGMTIDEDAQVPFCPLVEALAVSQSGLNEKVERAVELLRRAARPVVLVGQGTRAARATQSFLQLVEKCGIPVLTSRRGADLMADTHPLFFGRPGTYGQRSANFIIQNADVLLSIGCRLSLPLTGRNVRAFARGAAKIIVDIDVAELAKSTLSPNLAIAADAGDFIRAMLEKVRAFPLSVDPGWIFRCRQWRHDFPVAREGPADLRDGVDPYRMIEAFSEIVSEDAVLIAEGGTCLDYLMQSFKFKSGQRLLCSSGLEADGFALPGAVGAFLATRGKRTICFCEGPSFLDSLSEASSIVQRDLPVTIFVFCCPADVGIRQMQASYFGGRHVETSPQHAAADQALTMFNYLHRTPFFALRDAAEMPGVLRSLLAVKGTALCSVHVPKDHEAAPRMTMTVKPDGSWSSSPLEDMYPFLPRETLKSNMLIDILDEA